MAGIDQTTIDSFNALVERVEVLEKTVAEMQPEAQTAADKDAGLAQARKRGFIK
ncbi:hypothetical protein [Arthrobacter sp. B1805]|uniref:hypothetical protein n=1 Tax=Arthrobacter sp. B1805 TaxID=2058892 RepID=UPI0015E309CD|nr:hypothetical protein [Arthrobacter sp. B1805]